MADYIKEKIRMLKNDFGIKLTYIQVARLRASKSEYECDRIARDILCPPMRDMSRVNR